MLVGNAQDVLYPLARALPVVGQPQQFDVRQLFANNEQGVVYDAEDATTLYADNLGNSLVSGVEQSVGLWLDKRFPIGPELMPTLDLTSAAQWSAADSGTVINSSNQFTVTATSGSGVVSPVLLGQTPRKIEVSYTKTAGSAGTVQLCDANGTVILASSTADAGTLRTTYTPIVNAPYGRVYVRVGINGTTQVTITAISIKAVPGSHAWQPTAINRPIYSKRLNMLSYSERFDNGVWAKQASGTGTAPVVTANSVVAPNGTMTASSVVFNCGAGTTSLDASTLSQVMFSPGVTVAGTSYWGRVMIKALTPADIGKIVLFRHVAGVTYQRITLTADWVEVQTTEVAFGSAAPFAITMRGDGGLPSSTAGVGLIAAQISPAKLPHKYQRITIGADYDTDGFPSYLNFNGTNSCMFTQVPVDMSASDKATACLGITKASDAADGLVFELSSSSGSVAGSLALLAPGSSTAAKIQFNTRGLTANNIPFTALATYNAQLSASILGTCDLGAPLGILNINGVEVARTANATGGGNLANAQLFLGSRNNTTVVPFRGNINQFVMRGGATPPDVSALLQQSIATKVGIA